MIVESKPEFFPNMQPLPRAEPTGQEPSFLKAFSASFKRENPLFNLGFLVTQDEPVDSLFNVEQYGKDSEAYKLEPSAFFGTRNLAEFRQKELDVLKEKKWEEDMAGSGFGSFLGGMAGGLLSPTNLLPLGTVYKGAKIANLAREMLTVGAQAAGAASLDEFILQQEQQFRTTDESFMNIAGAAVLGGLLGGAAHGLSKREVFDITRDMALSKDDTAILPVEGHTSTVGAVQVAPRDVVAELPQVGGISKSIPGLEVVGNWISPVAANLSNKFSATVRSLTASLDSGGLHVDGLASAGGDIASLTKQWSNLLYKARNQEIALTKGTVWSGRKGLAAFRQEVTSALRQGGEHPDATVSSYANWLRQNLFLPLANEATNVGMKGFDKLTPEYIMKYAPRMARQGIARREHDKLFEVLDEHFRQVLSEAWSQRLERVNSLVAQDKQTAADLSLDKQGVLDLRKQLESDIKALPEKFPKVQKIAQEIRGLRAEAKIVGKEQAAELRAEAANLQKKFNIALTDFRKAENQLKTRFSRLDRTAFGRETAQGKALKQIETVEARMDAERSVLLRRIQSIIDKIDEWSDEKFYGEIDRLEELFKKTYDKWLQTAEKIVDLENDLPAEFKSPIGNDPTLTKAGRLELTKQRRAQEANDVQARLNELKDMDPAVARQALENLAHGIIKGHEEAQAVRAARVSKLNERIRDLDPAMAKKEADFYHNRVIDRHTDLVQRAADQNIRLVDGKFDVSKLSEQYAHEYASWMMGQHGSLPFFRALEERGPELARMLLIDETKTWSNGYQFQHFLENDIDYVIRAYLRKLAPDIELQRKFGTVNPMANDSEFGKQIIKEFDEARKEAAKITDEKKRAKQLDKIASAQETAIRNLHGIIERVRNQRGVPVDPMDPTYRMGKALRNLNVVRLMGKAVVGSFADLAGIVMKHGLVRTFRDGFLPLVTNFKQIALSAHEAKLAGLGLDLVLHGRAQALFEILDETRGGTAAERGLQWATNHFGFVSMMDHWNSGVKFLESAVAIPHITDALERRALGNATAKDIRFLDRLGLGEKESKQIWTQLERTGDRVEGVMLPNTESWNDRDAMRMFRGALARIVDDAVVTPGAERPLFSDGSELGRLIFQFRSFTFSSHHKLLWAGAQDLRSGDMAPLQGIVFSLALGALSYYIWARVSGPKQTEEMQNASLEKWAAESITRSFVLGAFAELQNVAEKVPGTVGQVATLGSGQTSRAGSTGPVEAALGPSFGAVRDLSQVVQGFLSGDPTGGDIHSLRKLLPYNNLWWLSRAFNRVEDLAK